MTTKRKAQGAAKNKTSAPELESLALMLAGLLTHPATPTAVVEHIQLGLNEVFNGLEDKNAVDCSPEYITRLLTQHARETNEDE